MSAVDGVLGRVTMYRLVTIALGGVLLAALVLSVLGPGAAGPGRPRGQHGGRGGRQRARRPRVRRPLAHPRAHRVGGHHGPDPGAAVLAGDHARRARRRRAGGGPGRAVQVRRGGPRQARAQPRRGGRARRGPAGAARSEASGPPGGWRHPPCCPSSRSPRWPSSLRTRRLALVATYLAARSPCSCLGSSPPAPRRSTRSLTAAAVLPAGLRGRVHAHRAAHPSAASVAAAARRPPWSAR